MKLGPSWQIRLLVGETNETIAARHAADGIGHDLGRFGGCVLVLEKLDKNKLGDLGAENLTRSALVASLKLGSLAGVLQLYSAQD